MVTHRGDDRNAVDWSANVGAGGFDGAAAEAGGGGQRGPDEPGEPGERVNQVPSAADAWDIGAGDDVPGEHRSGKRPTAGHEPDRARSGRSTTARSTAARGGSRNGLSDEKSPVQEDEARTGDDADPEAVARSICLRLLTGAPKTRVQLAEALRRKQVPDDVAERVLDRLGEVGLVDDAAFAEAWVQSRHTGRGLARRALRSELNRRGVDNETAAQALEQLDPDEEQATARDLVRRKLPSTLRLQSATRFRRLVGMLARKGYPSGLATRVVKEELAAEDQDIDELPDPEDTDLD